MSSTFCLIEVKAKHKSKRAKDHQSKNDPKIPISVYIVSRASLTYSAALFTYNPSGDGDALAQAQYKHKLVLLLLMILVPRTEELSSAAQPHVKSVKKETPIASTRLQYLNICVENLRLLSITRTTKTTWSCSIQLGTQR